jgi:hypothetical protein
VSCCQSSVGGIPWGLENAAFEARDEPARSVLKRLIAASLQGRPNGYYWVQRCDPLPSAWCFINLMHVPVQDRYNAVFTEPPNKNDPSRWFNVDPFKSAPR